MNGEDSILQTMHQTEAIIMLIFYHMQSVNIMYIYSVVRCDRVVIQSMYTKYCSDVVRLERPDLEKQRNELIVNINKAKTELKACSCIHSPIHLCTYM